LVISENWKRSYERESVTQLTQNVHRTDRMTAALQHRSTKFPFLSLDMGHQFNNNLNKIGMKAISQWRYRG